MFARATRATATAHRRRRAKTPPPRALAAVQKPLSALISSRRLCYSACIDFIL